MTSGKPAALTSSFRFTYNMLLNICKNIRTNTDDKGDKMDVVEESGDVKEGVFTYQTVIEKSFYRFLMTSRIPMIEKRIKELRDLLNDMEGKQDFDDMKIYFELHQLKERIMDKAQVILTKSYIMNRYLEYGRIVFIEVDTERLKKIKANLDIKENKSSENEGVK